ncbi:MAG: 5,10-methylenetetrahydrofolate reductase [Pyrobaculum sp.]
MEIIVEITPVVNKEHLLKKMEAVRPFVEAIDIPEAPGGRPLAHSLAVGALAKQLGLEPIVHIRLLDVNKTGLKSLLGGAKVLEIKKVVLLQGDPPYEGRPVGEVSTEEAVAEAKKLGLAAGALVSLKRDYWRRLEIGADFYLALHFSDVRQLVGLPPVVYPYIIIKTSQNIALIEKLRQTAVTPNEAVELVKGLEGVAPGAVLSAPGDFAALVKTLREIRDVVK